MKLKRPLWYYLLPLLSLGLLLAGWLYMAAAKPLLFPSPAETWQRLIKLIEVPLARVPLYQHILISLRRVLLAVLAACVLGGAVAGPFLACLYDGLLRALRDAPGSWRENTRRALR